MAANLSPKDFYSLVLEDDPSLAFQCLSDIPIDSRPPYVTFRNEEGEVTALHAAARAGHDQLVQLLLDSKSDKDARKKDGATPILIASQNGHLQVVERLLIAGADHNASNKNGSTPIYAASFNGHLQVVELLLAAGADKDAARNDGATPIIIASQGGHDRVVERLLAAGAGMNTSAKDGATPIYMASQNGHYLVVELLLAAGVDKNAAKSDGATPIFAASGNGHHRVVELLLAADVDMNTPANDGATPIYIASQNGHHHVVQLLLAANAAKDAPKEDGYTPLTIAQRNSHTQVVTLLRSSLSQSTIDAYQSRRAQLKSHLDERRSAFLRSDREAPFRTILDNFHISSSSRDLLFLTHGLEVSTLERLTIEVLKDVLQDNIPPLPTLGITALFKELQKVTLTPAHQSLHQMLEHRTSSYRFPPEPAFDVFICHRGSDDFFDEKVKEKYAEPLHQFLTDAGLNVFFDIVALQNVPTSRGVPLGIFSSKVALILLSEGFINGIVENHSPWCIFELRARIALQHFHLNQKERQTSSYSLADYKASSCCITIPPYKKVDRLIRSTLKIPPIDPARLNITQSEWEEFLKKLDRDLRNYLLEDLTLNNIPTSFPIGHFDDNNPVASRQSILKTLNELLNRPEVTSLPPSVPYVEDNSDDSTLDTPPSSSQIGSDGFTLDSPYSSSQVPAAPPHDSPSSPTSSSQTPLFYQFIRPMFDQYLRG